MEIALGFDPSSGTYSENKPHFTIYFTSGGLDPELEMWSGMLPPITGATGTYI